MTSNYVDNIMVYADPFHNYCVALIVPIHQVLEKWAKESGIKYTDFPDLCDKAEVVKEIQQSLLKVCFLPLAADFLKEYYNCARKFHIHWYRQCRNFNGVALTTSVWSTRKFRLGYTIHRYSLCVSFFQKGDFHNMGLLDIYQLSIQITLLFTSTYH